MYKFFTRKYWRLKRAFRDISERIHLDEIQLDIVKQYNGNYHPKAETIRIRIQSNTIKRIKLRQQLEKF